MLRRTTASVLGLVLLAACASSPLEEGFKTPPESARPHTWWHWMNGNVTREGITADLEAMQRVGIGGAQIFNVLEGIPPGSAPYMSEEWLDLVRFAAEEAGRLGLELCFHNCAGWSSSGGPWIDPEHAMQMVVTSETHASGPAHFDAALPMPEVRRDWYRDVAVLAFPTPTDDGYRTPDIRAKAGYDARYGLQPATDEVPDGAVVPMDRIVDLTASLGADGTLVWDVPAGEWTVVRIGHTTTGKENHPAPDAGRGLECDKLSREALDLHWAKGIQPVLDHLGPLAGKVLNNSLVDSYEVGPNNWTPRMRQEFIERRGYDPLPWLVTLTGRVVDGGEVTERFLWDFRRTIADLFADNYFGYFDELCREHGLLASVEPYDGPFECLQVGAGADIVMGEFWVGSGEPTSVKLASSVAHTHGIGIVGAESFTAGPSTGKWQNHPRSLKALGDLIWCAGVNRFIFHRFAQQPWLDLVPGMTMGQWGTHFDRTNTWWEGSRAWMGYLARSQYLLQRGQPFADVLFFGGEGAPSGGVQRTDLKAKGYDYDACGTDLVLALRVEEGFVVTPSGARYRLLVLPDTTWMTPELARKVRELLRAGATVVAPKPARSPSLVGYPDCDEEVHGIASELWGRGQVHRVVGAGQLFPGGDGVKALTALGIEPDFEGPPEAGSLAFIHRVVGEADVYFVSNQQARTRSVECLFRIHGRVPERWDPVTGRIEPAALWHPEGRRTAVTLDLAPDGSEFVVFRRPVPANAKPKVSLAFEPSGTAPAPHVPTLEIRSALYGVFSADDTRTVDVTDVLRERVEGDVLRVVASNSLAGDPAYLVVKTLRVEYALDGVPGTVDVREGGELVLPPQPWRSPALLPRLSIRSGDASLLAWEAGRYTVRNARGFERSVEVEGLPPALEVAGPWAVDFPLAGGARTVRFDELVSWPDREEDDLRYFSGTVTYRTTLDVPAEYLAKHQVLLLDLGRVEVMAEVRLNGQDLGILWKEPYRVDLTAAAHEGPNELEVRVTNLWPNRLIGDEHLPDDCEWDGIHLARWPGWLVEGTPRTSGRSTFTTWKHWHADDALLPSGLIGPVVLRSGVRLDVD